MVNSQSDGDVLLVGSREEANEKYLKIFNTILLLGEIIFLILKTLYLIGEAAFRVFYPVPEKSVKNEIVLITGAGRGIGKELALQYAELGATVVCWGISKDKNQATVDEIARKGYPKAYFYECDVTNSNAVADTATKVQQEVGDVTILINNAGIGFAKPFFEQSYSNIQSCLNTNLMSHFWTIREFLPAMVKKNHGHIVANCSVGGLMGLKNGLPYCASKFAVKGMMEALYQELRINPNCQVKVTTVYPYLVHTGIFKRAVIRFPSIMPILDARYVAKEIISAQRRNVYNQSIPGYFSALNNVCRLLPSTAATLVFDFFNISIEE